MKISEYYNLVNELEHTKPHGWKVHRVKSTDRIFLTKDIAVFIIKLHLDYNNLSKEYEFDTFSVKMIHGSVYNKTNPHMYCHTTTGDTAKEWASQIWSMFQTVNKELVEHSDEILALKKQWQALRDKLSLDTWELAKDCVHENVKTNILDDSWSTKADPHLDSYVHQLNEKK